MKKLLAIILACTMTLLFAACSSNSNTKVNTSEGLGITANDKSNYVKEWGTLTEDSTVYIYISGNDDSYYTDENIGLHLAFSDGKEFIIYKDYSFVIKQDNFIESGERFLSKVKSGRGIVDMKEDGRIMFIYYNDAMELESSFHALLATETENEYTYRGYEFPKEVLVTTPENWKAYREAGYNPNAEYFEDGNYHVAEYYENFQISKSTYYKADGSVIAISEYEENGDLIYDIWYNDDGTYTKTTHENEASKVVYYNANNTIDHWEVNECSDSGDIQTLYNADGTKTAVRRYDNEGQLLSIESYHPDGYIQSKSEFKPGVFLPDITYYNPDGTIKN